MNRGDKMFPYNTCQKCIVKDRCKRVTGQVKLPDNYVEGTECSGYIYLEEAFRLSNIPKEYRCSILSSIDTKSYVGDDLQKLNNVFRDIQNIPNIVMFNKNKGIGKTRTGITLLTEFIIANAMSCDFENPIGLYVKFGSWSNMVREQYQFNDSDYSKRVAKATRWMKKVPLLLLDDIGSGRTTDIIRDLTYDIIDYRKENMLPTIYTSNMTMEEMSRESCLGEIIVSRIYFNAVVLQLGGVDRRLYRS